MSIIKPVRAECRRILLTVGGLPDMKWEGRRYKPTQGVPWAAEMLEPVAGAVETLGRGGMVGDDYVYAIDVHYPTHGVTSDCEDLADAIRLAFWPGRAIVALGAGGVTSQGTVRVSERRPAIEGDVWFTCQTRVDFYVRRPTAQRA